MTWKKLRTWLKVTLKIGGDMFLKDWNELDIVLANLIARLETTKAGYKLSGKITKKEHTALVTAKMLLGRRLDQAECNAKD